MAVNLNASEAKSLIAVQKLDAASLSSDLTNGIISVDDLATLPQDQAFVEAVSVANPPSKVITAKGKELGDLIFTFAPDIANDPVAFGAFLKFNFSKLVNVIIGTPGNDILIGTAFHDLILGLDGNDILFGQAGNDALFGGNGNDILLGGVGNDILFGGSGNDTLFNDVGNDTLLGGAGNDYLYVLDASGSSVINGKAGSDTADYSALSQRITLKATGTVDKGSGLGTDQLVQVESIIATAALTDLIDASTAIGTTTSVTVDLSAKSLTVNNVPGLGTLNFKVSGFENVTGTAQNDSIAGNSSNNILSGSAGNDVLIGSSGNDALNGNAGIDVANYRDLGQAITLLPQGVISKGSLGTDKISSIETIIGATGQANAIDGSTGVGGTSFTVNLAANSLTVNNIPRIGSLSFTIENFVNVTGTPSNDVITGDSGNNFLLGGAGNDFLAGGLGNDNLIGEAGKDFLLGEAGDDFLSGGADNDFLSGEDGNDILNGAAGDDIANGEDGNDSILGENGNDILDGGAGSDFFNGGAGNDNILGGLGNDTIFGFINDDILAGGQGNDFLDGGFGNDILAGGANADTFAFFSLFEGIDTITDFNFGEGDKVQINSFGFGIGTSEFNRFSFDNTTNALLFDQKQFALLASSNFEIIRDLTIV